MHTISLSTRLWPFSRAHPAATNKASQNRQSASTRKQVNLWCEVACRSGGVKIDFTAQTKKAKVRELTHGSIICTGRDVPNGKQRQCNHQKRRSGSNQQYNAIRTELRNRYECMETRTLCISTNSLKNNGSAHHHPFHSKWRCTCRREKPIAQSLCASHRPYTQTPSLTHSESDKKSALLLTSDESRTCNVHNRVEQRKPKRPIGIVCVPPDAGHHHLHQRLSQFGPKVKAQHRTYRYSERRTDRQHRVQLRVIQRRKR